MGCGVSRFNREDGPHAASGPTYLYINPLHRRIEDFAFRRRGDRAGAAAGTALAEGSTPSSKQLLYVDPDEADTSSLGSDPKLDICGGGAGGRKSISSPRPPKKEDAAPATTPAAATLLPPTRMSEPPVQVMKAKERSKDGEETIKEVREVEGGGKVGGGGEAVEEVVKEVVAEKERGSSVERKDEDKKDEVEEEEDEEEEEAGGITEREDSILLYPGSPSFREYCVLCCDESGDAEVSPKNVDGKSDTTKVENEKEKAKLPISDSVVEVPKKSRKRRRFRVPRRGPADGIRSLLHVSSCSPRRSFSKAA